MQEAGIIAQQLRTAQKEAGADWLGLVDETDPEQLAASPGKLVFPLIQAVRQLADTIEAQAVRIATLEELSGAGSGNRTRVFSLEV